MCAGAATDLTARLASGWQAHSELLSSTMTAATLPRRARGLPKIAARVRVVSSYNTTTAATLPRKAPRLPRIAARVLTAGSPRTATEAAATLPRRARPPRMAARAREAGHTRAHQLGEPVEVGLPRRPQLCLDECRGCRGSRLAFGRRADQGLPRWLLLCVPRRSRRLPRIAARVWAAGLPRATQQDFRQRKS
jgi:hypothetical protein